MKIGLVAFRYHAGVLQMYLELCAAAGVEVVLFTGAHILRDIGQTRLVFEALSRAVQNMA